jgi:hypothetical protein
VWQRWWRQKRGKRKNDQRLVIQWTLQFHPLLLLLLPLPQLLLQLQLLQLQLLQLQLRWQRVWGWAR